jgi:hypothetical protein
VVHQSFGEAALAAAFHNLRVLFVDPLGRRGKLERSALQIPDLRLDAHVLFNALALEHALHGGAAPPTIARMLTLVRLIISLNRPRPAWSPRLTLSSICVLISRVTSMGGLRLLRYDPDALAQLQPCGTTSTTRRGMRGTGPTACGMERWRAQPLLPRALDVRLAEHALWRE